MSSLMAKRFVSVLASSGILSEPRAGSHIVANLLRYSSHVPSAANLKPLSVQHCRILPAEFQARRHKLVNLIRKGSSSHLQQHLICIPGSRTVFMARDVPYVFRQSSNFRYLCGITEPDCLLVLHSISALEYRSHVFIPQHTVEEEIWHGKSLTENQIKDVSGIDCVHPLSDLEKFFEKSLASLHGSAVGLWCDPTARLSRSSKLDDCQAAIFPALDDFLLEKASNFTLLGSPTLYVQECRLIKSATEASLMRHAAEISSHALTSAIRRTRPGMREREVWAFLDYECVNLGADRLAFPPVCASGSRAATIHYIKNSEIMEKGTMVLVDTGCEVEGYCSDISRVWPVDPKAITDSQALITEIVLWVQQTIINQLLQLGNNYAAYPTLDNLYHRMLELLARQLRQNEILLPKTSDHSKDTAIVSKYFCSHHISHYLGMDIHDCSDMSRSRPLQEGMSFTVEPGIYIAEDNQFAPSEYRGIGVRIEDDIFLGSQGLEILTKDCPSSLPDICNLFYHDEKPAQVQKF